MPLVLKSDMVSDLSSKGVQNFMYEDISVD